jgi:hypothetical protein
VEPELHHFGGAVIRCVSDSDGSGSKDDVHHRWIIKNVKTCNCFLLITFLFSIYNNFNQKKILPPKIVSVLKELACYIGRAEEPPEPHKKFYPKPKPHKNDAAPQP